MQRNMVTNMNLNEYRGLITKRKRHKYNAKATVVDGIRFASKAEATYYENLKFLKSRKIILDFKVQPKYPLYAGINYIADFEVRHSTHRDVVDVKGFETPVFRLKKRLFEDKYGIKILLFRNGKHLR
jgi:predicted nuclease of restriction endonuclease-like RecB superfamily